MPAVFSRHGVIAIIGRIDAYISSGQSGQFPEHHGRRHAVVVMENSAFIGRV
jgi:hypothetical protein